MSISWAKYISPLVFTHYHKSENTSLGLVTQLKTTADLWSSLICHYGASWLALTSVWTTYWAVQIALVKRLTGLKPIQNEPTFEIHKFTIALWQIIEKWLLKWMRVYKRRSASMPAAVTHPHFYKKQANTWPRDLESATEGRKKHQ